MHKLEKEYRQSISRGENMAKEAVIPQQLSKMANFKTMNQILSMVGRDTNAREFTPLIKQLIPKGRRIPIDGPITKAERYYLSTVLKKLLATSDGKILTNYDKVKPSDYGLVDAFQNFQKCGAKVTPGASARRYDNLLKYLAPNVEIDIDGEVLEQAMNLAIDIMKREIPDSLNVDFSVQQMIKNREENAKKANTGFPLFRNERKEDDNGMNFRRQTALLTHLAVKKHGLSGIPAAPAMIIARDQAKGNNIPLDKSPEEILDFINSDKLEYLPSKSRVVGAMPQITNNMGLAPLSTLYRYGKEHKVPPHLCALTSRENRVQVMNKYHKWVIDRKYYNGNFDVESFDLNNNLLGRWVAFHVRMKLTRGTGDLYGHSVEEVLEYIHVQSTGTKAFVLNPNTGKVEVISKNKAIASGDGGTNFDGSVVNLVNALYCLIKIYGLEETSSMIYECLALGFSFLYVIGDDLLITLKKEEDAERFVEISAQNGFPMGNKLKTAKGTFFIQERGTGEGQPIYPITRIATSMFYSETPKGYGGAVWDMSFLNTIYNGIGNPKPLMESYISFGMSLDKTKLGLFNDAGQRITSGQLAKTAAMQQAEFDDTIKEGVGNGDPSKAALYTNDGELKGKVVQEYFSLLNSTYQDKLQEITKQEEIAHEIMEIF